jgi:hypothetical protein
MKQEAGTLPKYIQNTTPKHNSILATQEVERIKCGRTLTFA